MNSVEKMSKLHLIFTFAVWFSSVQLRVVFPFKEVYNLGRTRKVMLYTNEVNKTEGKCWTEVEDLCTKSNVFAVFGPKSFVQ